LLRLEEDQVSIDASPTGFRIPSGLAQEPLEYILVDAEEARAVLNLRSHLKDVKKVLHVLRMKRIKLMIKNRTKTNKNEDFDTN